MPMTAAESLMVSTGAEAGGGVGSDLSEGVDE